MYHQLLNNTLSRSKLKNKNRYSPENSKWCNAICQDYKLINEFSKDKHICKECRNTLNLAETQITNKTITLEQFKENPNIVYNNILDIENKLRYCTICKTDKNISNFEKTRNQCIPCRQQITKDKVNDSINDILHDIELLKSNLFKLKNYLEKHNRSVIVKVISHYKIGRKSDEIKDVMIQNIIEYFRKEIEYMKCISGCGRNMTIEKISCGECMRKIEVRNSVRKTIDMDTFRNTILPTITDTLKEQLSQEDVLIYNRDQLFMIARKFQIPISTAKDNKDSVLDKINAKIEELKNIDRRQGTLNELQINTNISNKNIFKLHLDIGSYIDIKVINNMFNATELCKYGNKLLYNFKELKTTKDMVKKLKDDGFEDSEIWVGNKGDTDTFPQGSWIYYQLSILLCKWISVSFEQQIRKYIHKFIDKDVVMIGEIENIPDIENTICEFPESVDNIPDDIDIPITENKTIDIILENERLYFKEFKLTLPSGVEYLIPVRQDGYINATALCKAGKKKFNHYHNLKQTQEFITELEKSENIPESKLIIVKHGGISESVILNSLNPKIQGTWIHRKVAYNLAQWISPSFAVQVSKILDELFILGKVELNKEHSNEERENMFIKKIHNVEDELEIVKKERDEERRIRKERDKTIDKMKYKRTCHKFKQGPVIYVFESFGRHKIGKVGKIDTKEEKFGNLNERLASHRCMDRFFKQIKI